VKFEATSFSELSISEIAAAYYSIHRSKDATAVRCLGVDEHFAPVLATHVADGDLLRVLANLSFWIEQLPVPISRKSSVIVGVKVISIFDLGRVL
jgi:hypothetical protein